jgi:hypothetical protein
MRNLPLPSRENDQSDLQRSIRQYQYKGDLIGHDITHEELKDILALYDSYDSDRGAPSDILKGEALPEALREAVYKAYDTTQKGRRLEDIRNLVRKGVDLCPVCGIDPAEELDHFLPRSVFKPLAIFTHNLVPLCHSCNNAKLAGFGAQADSGFLHPYYDLLPDVDFLRVDIAIKNGGLSIAFAINLDAALPLGFAGRLDAQMQSLSLNSRYEQEVNTYLSGHAITLHLQFLSRGSDGVREFLQLQARYEISKFYRNHWRPVLLQALAAHAPFVEGGFSEVLPVPPEVLDDIKSTRHESSPP